MKKAVPIKSISVILCIILSLLFVIYMDFQKENYHIDETYSYILSNSHDADKLSGSDKLWNKWVSHEDWNEFTTVQKGELFDYKTVYLNNTTDAHPPLFYWCLHTVCSLFPNTFSMWFGLGLNLLFYGLSLIVLYFISRRVIKNEWLAILPLILWGFSPIAVDTAMFIRMYSLLTLLTLLSVLMHLKMYQNGQNLKRLIILFIITFLGAMTQYYFVISAFCISLTYCIYKLVKKEYRQMLLYGGLELLAVGLLFVAYPAAISQITGSSTNNIGNEVAATFFSISGWASTILNYVMQVILGWGRGFLNAKALTVILFAISAITLMFVRIVRKKSVNTNSIQISHSDLLRILLFGISTFLTIIIISKMSYKFVYIRYLYHMIPLFITVAIMLAEWLIIKFKLSKTAVICILTAFSLLNAGTTIVTNSSNYLFVSTQEAYDSIYEEYGDVPIVLLSDRKTYVLTGNYQFLKNYSNTYIMPKDNVDTIDSILEEKPTENGIILMVWTDTEWSQGYDSSSVIRDVQENCTLFDNYEQLKGMNFCDIYYLSRES